MRSFGESAFSFHFLSCVLPKPTTTFCFSPSLPPRGLFLAAPRCGKRWEGAEENIFSGWKKEGDHPRVKKRKKSQQSKKGEKSHFPTFAPPPQRGNRLWCALTPEAGKKIKTHFSFPPRKVGVMLYYVDLPTPSGQRRGEKNVGANPK